MDEALPNEPIARYSEANRRFMQQLRQVFASPGEKHTALFNPEKQYAPTTAEQVAHMLMVEEQVEG